MTVELEFAGLTRAFGRLRVLDAVSARVAGGETLLVTGGNGAGKSTLLRCLAGLLRPQAGVVRHREEGRDLDVTERRRRVGWVAPDLAFYEALTAGENLELFCRLRRLPTRRAAELLQAVELPAERAAGALSSGMRQRLRWAFALLHRPRLLLLDEPFQNLDGAGEAAARDLLAAHLDGGGLAVVATPAPLGLPSPAVTLHLGAVAGRPVAA